MKKVLSGSLKQPAPRAAVNADEEVRYLAPADVDARRQREVLAKDVYDSDEEAASGPQGPQCAQA